MEKLIYGTAYYDEYMPYDRLAEDVKMMKKAGINTVRIAESTWSTCEPQEGVFDFLTCGTCAGCDGRSRNPGDCRNTYLCNSYMDGKGTSGCDRNNKRRTGDIRSTSDYGYYTSGLPFYAERVIRKLMEVSAHRKCVIGFQVDNETNIMDSR